MGNKWREMTWGEVVSLEYGKRIQGYKDAKGPVRVYGSNGAVGWTSEPLEMGPGVILGRKGAYRGVEYSKGPFFVIDTAYYVKPKVPVDMRWLYFAIRHYKLGDIDDGSPIPSTTRAAVYVRRLNLPPLSVQRRIAHILGTLDDKIELNRRMNRTLEAMAAAIFKSWFIDFDPVHAKAAGRDPGLPKEIADLFPDSFQDSELGPIPEGWGVKPLSELATLTTRSIRPSDHPEAVWEHYSIPAYDEGQQPHLDLGKTIKSGKYTVPEQAVLVSKLNPRFPRTWLPQINDAARAICSTEFMPFVPVKDRWRPFIYEMVRSSPFQEELQAHASGSTGSRQRVKPKEIVNLSVITPRAELINTFSDIAVELHSRVLLNRRENHTLASLRDALLPKLLCGEIDESVLEQVEVV